MLDDLEVIVSRSPELSTALLEAYKILRKAGYELIFLSVMPKDGHGIAEKEGKAELDCTWGPMVQNHAESHEKGNCKGLEQLKEAVKYAVDQGFTITEDQKKEALAKEAKGPFLMPPSSQTIN